MLLMNRKVAENWARIRSKGRVHFVWVRGVVGLGLTMAVLFTAFDAFIAGAGIYLRRQLPYIAYFLIGGYVWGQVGWFGNEWMYAKVTKEAPAK
jgi:hypothetical protein